jgi:uroporphyrinogen decarboxylase
MMYSEPELFAELLDRLADITVEFLRVQIEAGASAIQLFDSWVGTLSARDYQRYVLPVSAKVFDAVAHHGVPRIHFGVGTGELLILMSEAGADVVGVDWRTPLSEAARRVGAEKAFQGNLDPAVLFAPTETVERKAREVLASAQVIPGHVFNLGHGVLPATDPDALTRLVEFVHQETAVAT